MLPKKTLTTEQIDWGKIKLSRDWKELVKAKEIWIGTSWKKFLISSLFFVAIIFMALGYKEQGALLTSINEHPCDYVKTIEYMCSGINPDSLFNPGIAPSNITIVINNGSKKESENNPPQFNG